MPWTATVTLDDDSPNVGTATATWTDPEQILQPFTYSKRAKVTQVTTFIAKAKAALIARNTKVARETALSATLEGLLNG